uniref:snRNA-activating protein complex subunit 3 n=1 Tax=Strigamia maritima TaxID=126957 RepID=T1IWR8_STRMM
MDRVHNPDARNFISPEIDLRNLLTEWIELGADENINAKTDLAPLMDVSPAIIDELEAVCSINNLTCEDEPVQFLPTNVRKPKNEPMEYVAPVNHNLQCLKVKEALNEKRAPRSCIDRKVLNHADKFRFSDPNLTPSGTKNDVKTTLGSELVVQVTLYQPYKKQTGSKYIRELKVTKEKKKKKKILKRFETLTNLMLQMEQQIVVLGSQKLTALRDRFVCLADISVTEDLSENPDLSNLTKAKDIYTSGLFYINGTLYDDMRNPQSRANSGAIVEWANQYPDMEIGPFETKLMEETRFIDLKVRLGYPYLYQHQGDCEHLLVFQDIRLMNSEDCPDINKYPIVTSISCRKRVICMVCHLLTAKWVTSGNQRVPADPFFFCDSCFRQFNYDKNGQKIGQFFAQPFVDRSALL